MRPAGQFIEELGLIGFDDQEKVSLFFLHQLVGRFAGSEPFAGLAATAGAQAAELVLVEGLGELADVDQRVIARNHGGGGNGHDGGDPGPWPA